MLRRMKKVYAFILMGTICMQPTYAINHISAENTKVSTRGEQRNEEVMGLLDNVRIEKIKTANDTKIWEDNDINNIIPNGNFEKSSGMMPSDMKITNKVGSPIVTMDSKQSYMGDSSVKISSQEVGTIVIEPSNNNLLAKDSEIYRLSVRAKGNKEGSGKVKFKYTHKKGGRTALTTYSQALEVNKDWQELTILYDPMQSTSGQSVFLEVDVQAGDIWVDEWRLEKLQRYDKLELPETLVVDISGGIQPMVLPLSKDEGVNKDERLLWITSNEEILAVENGILVPKKAGIARVTVMTLDRIIRDSCEVTVTGQIPEDQIVEVAGINLDLKEIELETDRAMELKADVLPSHATDASLTWTSSDEKVAMVIDGRVIGKNVGRATITVATGNGINQTCEVTVKQSKTDDFTTMIEAWGRKSNLKLTDEILEKVRADWESMDKNSSRKGLWYEPTVTVPRVWQSDKINGDANRLRQMAIAATMEGSPLKENKELIQDTVSGTMWLYENCFSLNNFMGYTWWQWEIGIPQIINDIFVMMNPYFTEKEINEVMGFIHNSLMPYPEYMEYIAGGRLPNTGANLTDQVKVALVPAMFMKDAAKIERCKELVLESLNFVESGDGFYEDGSFIQHQDIAYTGSYGAVYLGGITSILDIFEGTSYVVSGKQAELLYKIVEDAYLPLIFKGPIMDMVNGRSIVRKNSNDHMGGAHSIVVDSIRLAQSAPEPYRTSILAQCKYLIESDNLCDYTQGTSRYITNVINRLLADESIIAKEPSSTHKEYGGMNRTVHHEPNFSVGISKSSNRIKTYEVTNHENQKGWHTGDGMMYLYNNDLDHYDGDYWVTVNWDRLPGVTADPNRSRNWGSQSSGDAQARPKNTWSGGVQFQNKYGASGMNLQAVDGKVATDLTANKSWFMFNDVVIAIGSAINNTDNRMIETTIEQRRIQGDNTLLVDGIEQPTELGWEQDLNDVSWVHLAGNNEGADIGYYFPNTVDLKVTRKEQQGTYHDIRVDNDKEVHTSNFLTMWVEHGTNPINETYAYALVPGATPEEMKKYSRTPSFEILAREDNIHAIRHIEHDIIAANFYGKGIQEVDYIKVDGEASVMVQDRDGVLTVSISDPTMERKQVVIELKDKVYTEELTSNPNVKVQQTETGIRLIVDTTKALSKTFEVQLAH